MALRKTNKRSSHHAARSLPSCYDHAGLADRVHFQCHRCCPNRHKSKEIEFAIEMVKPQVVQKNVACRAIFFGEPPHVYGDALRIRQILLNLLSNAAKFTEEGHIHVITDVVEENQRTFVRVRVEDTGIGIPEEHFPKRFEAFYMVDSSDTRKVGGSGLGLSIVKHLVEMHGGRIDVESAVGVGSTFTFTLPVWRWAHGTPVNHESDPERELPPSNEADASSSSTAIP